MKRTRNRRMRRNKTRRKRSRRGGHAKINDGNTQFASTYIHAPENGELFYRQQKDKTIPQARYIRSNGKFIEVDKEGNIKD